VVDLDDDFQGIDICWVETPLNPTGEARFELILGARSWHLLNCMHYRNLQHYADKASRNQCLKFMLIVLVMVQIHSRGGRLIVDATFAPPPLQYPFKWGADIIMHSGMPIVCTAPLTP
jgi:cystathionine gamma-synthase